MKKKIFIAIIITVIFFNSCRPIWYLPSEDKPGSSPYGSFIRLNLTSRNYIEGELIAVDNRNIYMLREFKFLFAENYKKVYTIPHSEIRSYRIRYANTKHTGELILGGILLPILPSPAPLGTNLNPRIMPFHGFFSGISILINMIVIGKMQEEMYLYRSKDLPITNLHKFARYPQGIPENVDIRDIK